MSQDEVYFDRDVSRMNIPELIRGDPVTSFQSFIAGVLAIMAIAVAVLIIWAQFKPTPSPWVYMRVADGPPLYLNKRRISWMRQEGDNVKIVIDGIEIYTDGTPIEEFLAHY